MVNQKKIIKNWRKLLQSELEVDSSLEIQKNAILYGKGPIILDWNEIISGYFDDRNLSEGLEWAVNEGFLSNKEADILKPFHEAFKAFLDEGGAEMLDKEVLKDPKWIQITVLAGEVLERIDFDKLPKD